MGFWSKPFCLLVVCPYVLCCCMSLWLWLWLCVYVVGYVVGVVRWCAVEVHGRSSRVEFMAGVGVCVVFFVVSLFNLYCYSFSGCGYVGTHHTIPTGHLSIIIIPCIESKRNSNGVLCREVTKTTKGTNKRGFNQNPHPLNFRRCFPPCCCLFSPRFAIVPLV